MIKKITTASILILLLSVLNISCGANLNELSGKKSSGKVQVEFDLPDAFPGEFTSIEINFDNENSLENSFKINLAELNSKRSFSKDLNPGKKNLKIKGLNSFGDEISSGNIDINVSEEFENFVKIEFPENLNDSGKIFLTFNNFTNWNYINRDHILSPKDFSEPPIFTTQAKVLHENDKYKFWFSNTYQLAHNNFRYAESKNGSEIDSIFKQTILKADSLSDWAEYSITSPVILKDDENYKLYYAGFNNEYDHWHIGMAISDDGINWQQQPRQIISSSDKQYQIIPSDILKVNGKYYLYYTSRGKQLEYYRIWTAVSDDGINWKNLPDKPVFDPTFDWEGKGILYGTVIYDSDGYFKMMYETFSRKEFGFAISKDGLNWEKPYKTPVFFAASWEESIHYPHLRKFGETYKLYYTSNQNGILGISVAETGKL